MYSAGLFQTRPGMREALTGPPRSADWLAAAKDRGQRRMHTTDTERLQSQVEELRLYVSVLFKMLATRGVCTVEDAQRMVAAMVIGDGESDAATVRDVVSGEALAPEENPFLCLGEDHGYRRRTWRERIQPEMLAAVLFCGTIFAAWFAWLLGWKPL